MPRTEPMTSIACTDVVLERLHSLLPTGLGRGDVEAWLRAPLAGAPLCRRLVEPILALQPRRVRLRGGPVAEALKSALEREGCFGLELVLDERSDLGAWRLPGDGLLDLDVDLGLPDLLTRPERVQALPGDRTPGLGVPFSERRVPLGGPEGELLVRLDTSAGLRRAALGVLTGAIGPYPSAGTLRGDALVAREARIHPTVHTSGACAVGAGSFVAPGAWLDEGAIVGRDCYVGPGARVSDSVLLDGARAEAGEVVEGVVRSRSSDLF
jgi:hypothetical protein